MQTSPQPPKRSPLPLPLLLLAAALAAVAGAAAPPAGGAGIVRGADAQRIDAYLTQLEEQGFSGALLVARGDEVILSRGYGLADRTRGVPVGPDTVFTSASVGKQFTAAAVMTLAQLGVLDVHDPIGAHLDGVPADKRAITLHQLLTHTSGLPENVGDEREAATREAMLARLLRAPLRSAPGAEYAYSNAGYNLLAAIVEIASGQPFGDFLQERLFAPAGMTRTGYRPEVPDEALAHGYDRLTGDDLGTLLDLPRLPDGPSWFLRGAGGVLTTVGDMHRWDRALRGDAVLSEDSKRLLFGRHVALEDGVWYGYGWGVVDTEWGTTLHTHTGGSPFATMQVRRYPDDDVFLVAVSNSPVHAATLAPDLARALFDPAAPLEPPAPDAGDELPDSPAGDMARSWIALIAGADDDAIRAFVRERMDEGFQRDATPAEYVALFRELQRDLAAPELLRVTVFDPFQLTFTLRSGETDAETTFLLAVERRPPHRLVGLDLQ